MEIYKPKTLDEAKLLLFNNENTKILAGGTDLIISIRKESDLLTKIIDISKISDLYLIEEDESFVSLGSMITFAELEENIKVRKYFNVLYECSKHMGSPQVRNVATIGGNVINAAPAADSIPCLISLDSEMVIESIKATRKIKVETYFENYEKEQIRPGEILTKLIIPKKNNYSGYYKLGKRNSLAIARINVAVSLNIQDDIIKNISIAVGAAGRFPFKITQLEGLLLNKNKASLLDNDVLNELEQSVYNNIKGRNTADFKREAVKGVYKHAINNALGIEGVCN
ncbi:FAD binding domain-containing protein [Clostridium sp. 1001271B_151109_B4]|uniref:FAD binding domain-containing protein n=1 Tax=Clostridium sp. 1001271B_151109_B4 TaxID=2787148 RepID=UPI0018A95BDE|nr:FAD binding domain-containing protein [Clostridium sp. 1001271B_151109_B4]